MPLAVDLQQLQNMLIQKLTTADRARTSHPLLGRISRTSYHILVREANRKRKGLEASQPSPTTRSGDAKLQNTV